MPAVDPFERIARRIRRGLRNLPVLEPVANRVGLWLWRRRLNRVVREEGIALPQQVTLDPALIHRRLPAGSVAAVAREAGESAAAELGGRWDLTAVPLERGARAHVDRPACEDNGPVVIAFDRRGRTCLVSGRAELTSALDAGRTVSARVAFRHSRWAQLARQVVAYAKLRGGRSYQPYLHPDLAGIPSDQGHERFRPLLEALPVDRGILVDLGANAGYFSHRFEESGFDCIAVERSEKEAYFLRALRDALERDFTILKGSLTDVRLPALSDVVLALNIFHHFLKTEDSYNALRDFLQRLQTRYLLLQPHLGDDPQMATAYRNMAPSEFVEWVEDVGGFSSSGRVGIARDGRPIYLLSAA